MAGLIFACLFIILFYLLLFETVSTQILLRQNSLEITVNFVFLAINFAKGGKTKTRNKEKRAKKSLLPVKAIVNVFGELLKKSSLKVNKLCVKTVSEDFFDASSDFGKGVLITSLVLSALKTRLFSVEVKEDAISFGRCDNELDIEIRTLLIFLLFSLIKIAFSFIKVRLTKRRKIKLGNTRL